MPHLYFTGFLVKGYSPLSLAANSLIIRQLSRARTAFSLVCRGENAIPQSKKSFLGKIKTLKSQILEYLTKINTQNYEPDNEMYVLLQTGTIDFFLNIKTYIVPVFITH